MCAVGKAGFLAGDVSDVGYADALVDRATSQFGGLDGAVNNAGIVGEMQPVPDMGINNWLNVISVNLTSAFLAAKAQIPAMKKRGKGSIVFTSSFVGFSNEIGRASCRESVCKYVSISVVAVSLKTKIQSYKQHNK